MLVQLGEGKEAFLAVRADKGLLLCAVGGLMLAELLGRGEELFTFVACEDSVTLLQLLLVLVPMTLPHVSLFSFGVTEGDKALEALQTLMLIGGDQWLRLHLRRGGPHVVSDNHLLDLHHFHAFTQHPAA